MNFDNIASKNFQLSQKIESIGPDHYRIALSLCINYRTSMGCDCHPCFKGWYYSFPS